MDASAFIFILASIVFFSVISYVEGVGQCLVCPTQQAGLVDSNRPCDTKSLVSTTCSNSAHCLYSENMFGRALLEAIEISLQKLDASHAFFLNYDKIECTLSVIEDLKEKLIKALKPRCRHFDAYIQRKNSQPTNNSGIFMCDQNGWQFCEAGLNFGAWLWQAAGVQESCFDHTKTVSEDETTTPQLRTEALPDYRDSEKKRRPRRSVSDDGDCTNETSTEAGPFFDHQDQQVKTKSTKIKFELTTVMKTTEATTTTASMTTFPDAQTTLVVETTVKQPVFVNIVPIKNVLEKLNALDESGSCFNERRCVQLILSTITVENGRSYCCSWDNCNVGPMTAGFDNSTIIGTLPVKQSSAVSSLKNGLYFEMIITLVFTIFCLLV